MLNDVDDISQFGLDKIDSKEIKKILQKENSDRTWYLSNEKI